MSILKPNMLNTQDMHVVSVIRFLKQKELLEGTEVNVQIHIFEM